MDDISKPVSDTRKLVLDLGKEVMEIEQEAIMFVDTKWIAEIFQKYSVEELEKDGSFRVVCAATQVVALSVKAGSALDAVDKAAAWIEKSGIKDTYVGKVRRDGIKEVEE